MKKLFLYPITYIIYISSFFAFGVSIAFLIKSILFFKISLIISIFLIVSAIILKNNYYISIMLLIISCFFIGYSYTISSNYNTLINPLKNFNNEIEAYNAKIIFYEGVIGFRDRYVAYVNKVYDGTNWHNYSGNIRIYNGSLKPIYINDEITFSAKINLYKNILTNDNSDIIIKALEDKKLYGVSSIYNYNNFVVQKSKFSIMNYLNKYGLYFRNIIKKSLGKNINGIEYSIAQCIMTGDKNIIPYNIRQYFIDSGISHILSISGLHISMILFIISLIMSFFPISFYKRIFISAIITVIIYVPITLFSVSIIRASIMAICILISYYFDRNRNSINALFLSGLIILIINPNSIKEIGFQFSFLATLSIIMYYPIFDYFVLSKIENLNTDNNLINMIKNMIIKILSFLSINILALILIIPLSIHHFSILNLTSLAANIFAVPLSFIILSSSLITIITYQIYYPLSIYPAKTTEYAANILITLSEKFADIKFLKYNISCGFYTAILITIILILIGFIIRIRLYKKSLF